MKNHISFVQSGLIFFTILSGILCNPAHGQELDRKSNGINVIVTQSPQIIVKLEEVTHNRCFGDQKGAIYITARGGYPPYKYYWDNGDTTQNIAGLKAGKYRVAVYDKFSCSDTLEVTIKEPSILKGKVVSVRDILCYGYNHGAVDIEVTGGVAPYSYKWSNDSVTQDLAGLTAGRYSALITDANGCQDIATADVEEKPLIIRTVDDITNIKCNGDKTGSIDITVSGGVPPYEYHWSNGSSEKDLRNLPSGEYEVMVKDSEGCTEVSLVKVKEPALLSIAFDELRHLRCNDDGGGVININVTGGVAPYSYKWNTDAITQDLIGIPAGQYSVEVVDRNGCNKTVSTSISEPDALRIDLIKSQNVSYFGGKDGVIAVEVSGGVSPYKYKWNNGSEESSISNLEAGFYSLRATDVSGCARILNVALTQPQPLQVKLVHSKDILCHGDETGEIGISVMGGVPPYKFLWSNGAIDQNISGLKAGNYTVTVTDMNGHKQTLEESLTEPPAFQCNIANVTDIPCFDGKFGAIDLEVTGGVLPYRYRWSNGQTSQDLKDIPAGEYAVKITDANQCELNIAAQVSQPEPMILNLASTTEIRCFGENTGSITVDIKGGVTPYVFRWDHGAETQNLTGLKAGKYSLTATDANGCTSQLAAEINEPELLVVDEQLARHVDCFGNLTGAISVNVRGGVAPYAFAWNNGQKTKDISNIGKGDYSLRVTDANGCSEIFQKKIEEPAKLVRTLEKIDHIQCFGEARGNVSINVTGGVRPYTFKWSNGGVSKDLENVKAGRYTSLIIDSNGCSDSLVAVVNQNQQLESSATITHIQCHGDTTGKIDLAIVGGVKPYAFKWSNGAETEDLINIAAGAYSATITDAKGCVKIQDAQVAEPSRFVASLASETDILCHGESTGSINIRVSGGVQPYQFHWSNGASSQNLETVPAGRYVLAATDANGCKQSIATTLHEPTPIDYSIRSISNLVCNGDMTGSVDVVVSGGASPYEYRWNNGVATPGLHGVAAGKYNLRVKDSNGCIKTLDAEVSQPDPLVLELDTIMHVLCHGENKGAVQVKVDGGVKPYRFSWSNGAETQNLSLAPAGYYTVTVTDAHGCSRFLQATIEQPEPLIAGIDQINQLACYNDSDAAIALTVGGGAKPYLYKWSNGSTSQNLSNLKAGNYSVKITDKNGCSRELSATIIQPAQLKSELTASADISCHGGDNGFINITVVGGTAPFTYQWNNGAETQDLKGIKAGSYSVRIIDGQGCRDSLFNIAIKQPDLLVAETGRITHLLKYGQNTGAIDMIVSGGVKPYRYAWTNGASTEDLASVPGGNYTVKVTDANGCVRIVDAIVNQPSPLSLSIASVTDIKCFNDRTGSIEVNVSGGAPPYAFQWNDGSSAQNLVNAPAGDYTLRVTDSNGNTEVISARIAQPVLLTVKEVAIRNVLCNNEPTGSIHITVAGGVAPYQFKWNNGAASKDIENLMAGSYALTVTDSHGCSQTFERQVTQPEPFVASVASVSHVNCMGESEGAIGLKVAGGVTPYSYLWSNGDKMKDISKIAAGKYSVNITDANGCKNALEAVVEEPSLLTARIASVVNNLCNGQKKGSISLEIEGGSEPYTFLWNTGAAVQNLDSLAKGDYSVKITDDKGCSKELKASVTEPPLLSASIKQALDVKCFGQPEGSIKVNIEGGVMPYTFSWSNGATTHDLQNIPAGAYHLTVRDANGCISTTNAVIKQPELLSVQLDGIHHVLCNGNATGLIDINVAGGVFPYSFKWSNGSNAEDLVNAVAGTYMVNVKDANGCAESLTATLEQPEKLTVFSENIEHLKCAGDASGFIQVGVTGGVAPYKYLWSNGEMNPAIRNLDAGDYRVMVSDANNCSSSFSATVTAPPALISSIDAISDIRCNGENSGSITVSVSEGTLPYSFQWNNGATTKDLKGVSAGAYKLTITEGNGCRSVLEATIEQPVSFSASVVGVEHVQCFGEKTGRINVDVEGGTLPYRFSWSNGETTRDIDSLGADSYALMITDGNGCIKTIHAEIAEPPLLTLKIDSVRNVKCCGDRSGAIFITVEGGVAPYKYQWSNGANTQDIENLVLGVYTVNVTDANNCVITTADNTTLYEQIVSQGMFTTRDINFDVAKSIIKPESFGTINRIASFMKEHAELSFRIDGHTDSDGTDTFNQKLSEERADAIKEALIKFGIRENRLVTKGWGESQPVVPNTTPENKALNRRVEFIALTGTLDGTLIENHIREIQ